MYFIVNGDGINDMIVGAESADNPTIGGDNKAGMVYVIFGKNLTGSTAAFGDVDLQYIASGNTTVIRILGAAAGDRVGMSVSNAGDVNSDGLGDFIIGACKANSQTGIAYVIFGRNVPSSANGMVDLLLSSSTMPVDIGFRILGAALKYYLGSSVSNAGDVNGDGVDDLIVGAYLADPPNFPGSDSGIVYVIFGRDIPGGAAPFGDILAGSFTSETGIGFRLFGTVASTTGFSVSGAGDVNDDGIDDIVIGAPYAEPPDGQFDAGVSYVIYGRKSVAGAVVFGDIYLSSINASSDIGFCILGAFEDDHSGCSVSGAGDVNGDAVADVLVGTEFGSSYVIYGTPANPTSHPSSQPSSQPSRQPSRQPSAQPSTQPTLQPSTIAESKFILDYDLSDLSIAEGFTMTPWGTSVSAAGDINGDGVGDLIIGASWVNTNTGTVTVVFGRKGSELLNLDLANFVTGPDTGFRILAAASGDQIGYSVSNAGDLNKDGVSDLIIGAQSADVNARTNSGITYVIFGRRVTAAAGNAFTDIQLTNTAMAVDIGFRILGAAAGDLSGYSVNGAGDVNGDGIDDVIIGAVFAD